MNLSKHPVIFIPHGGGPWHVMPRDTFDPVGYSALEQWLTGLRTLITPDVKALLVISGHWEESRPTVNFSKSHTLLYDYYGSPDYTYKLKWDAGGSPTHASRVEGILANNGFNPDREYHRGLDHGVFVPLMVTFPQPTIPIIQLSLVNTLEPQTHIAIGKALAPLREEGFLIIGSGMSYHNMRGFMSGSSDAQAHSREFNEWLLQAVSKADPYERNSMLANWHDAPGALQSHPRSEHLLPLHVVAGAAGNSVVSNIFSSTLMGVQILGFTFADKKNS